jgi:hypothetical protein
MLWTHPLLLAGLGALAAPILIHLLLKVQGRKVRFSSLRFLPQTKPSRDKKKIRHWLLLLLRLVLLALLVAAFARPYWPARAGMVAPQNRTRAVVFLIDGSASMQATEGNTKRWNAALATRQKLLDELTETDQVAIVRFAGQAEVVVPWGPRAVAEQALANLKVTSEPGKLADGLRLAATLLDQAPSSPELVLVSDLQKSTCDGLDSISLPAGTRCEFKPVGGFENANVAITGVVNKNATGSAITIDLQNFCTRKETSLPVNCSIDGQPFFQSKIDIDANGSALVPLPSITASPGWHRLQIDLVRGDSLAGDNRFFASVFIPESISVLVAEPHLELKIFERSSYFITSALNPEFSADEASTSSKVATGPFNVTVVDPANLAASIASGQKPAAIVLPPLPVIPLGLGAALKSYVENGGGLLAWIGSGIDTLGYNNELGNLWPAHLIEPETYASVDENRGWRLDWWNRDSPLFGHFGEGGQGDLTLPQFKQRMRLDLTSDADLLATFEDKVPFLISRKVGSGRVLLVNSSADVRGSDWPIHKTFLPLVQRMAYFLAQRNPQVAFSLAPSLVPDRHGQLDLGTVLARQHFKLSPPMGPAVGIETDETGIAHELNLGEPGCYEVRDAKNKVQKQFSVNFPAVESDLAAYRPDEIQFHFASTEVARFSHVEEGTLAPRNEAWPWLFALLLPLLCLELAWANRIRV